MGIWDSKWKSPPEFEAQIYTNLQSTTRKLQTDIHYDDDFWTRKAQRYQRSHPLKDLNMFGGRYK